jgi:GTP cyclohydrolase-4
VRRAMRDLHATVPRGAPRELREVGVSGVRKPLSVQRPERVVTLEVEFSVHVDLPADRKGSDLSRNAESLAEIVDATATKPVESLESACRAIARDLLGRHGYARRARASARAGYFLARGVRPARQSFEEYTLAAEAHAERRANGESPAEVWSIGAEAVGMTACPCAMETARARLELEYPLLADPSLRSLPILTHNQRNRTALSFEFTEPGKIEADEIIAAIEAAQSSPTYSILKRGDEADVVLRAHRHPKFVEDVLRDLLGDLPARFPDLPGSTLVSVATRSEESIHKYDVTASHRALFSDLLAGRAP